MLEDIFLYVKLVDSGGFAEVAKYVGINQSTVSRRIKSLEKELDTILIKRNTRQFELTPKGKILYDNFRGQEQYVEGLLSKLYQEMTNVSGTLNVVLPVAFASYVITPYLGEFIRNNPRFNLNLHYRYSEINMVKEAIDLAIVPFLPRGVSSKPHKIHSSKGIICCSKEYIKKYGTLSEIEPLDRDTANQLTDEGKHIIVAPILQEDTKPGTVVVYNEKTGAETRISIPERLAVNNFLHAKMLVQSGSVIAGLPEDFIREELASGEIIRLLPDYNIGYVDYYLISNIKESDRRYQLFYQFIKECLGRLTIG